jgi:putative ABC transport system substrate-binding protein
VKRRALLLVSLSGAALAWPLAAATQQPRVPTIGFLGAASPKGWEPWVHAFVERLRELGWIDGRNVAIEYRWAEARGERYTEIAAEFVRLDVSVIVTVGSAVAAAKRATSTIPIVFALAKDPVGSGLVSSLARPGGNVTGVSNQSTDLAGKQIQVLREAIGSLGRLAIMANTGYSGVVIQMNEARAAARTIGLVATVLEIRRAEDIAPAIDTARGRADALYVCPDSLVAAHRFRIGDLVLAARLPAISAVREFTDAGLLMSYGAIYSKLWRRAGDYVDKILRGAKPEDLPVEQPTEFELVINLKTAKTLGLTIPQSILQRADEVIE